MNGPTFVIPKNLKQVQVQAETVPVSFTQTVQLAEPAPAFNDEQADKVAHWLSDRMSKMIERELLGTTSFKDPLSA